MIFSFLERSFSCLQLVLGMAWESSSLAHHAHKTHNHKGHESQPTTTKTKFQLRQTGIQYTETAIFI